MNNVAFIYQPHFMTGKFRVALDSQKGVEHNIIIVTCSPEYNGVYRYPVSKMKNYELWRNKNKVCICVPIEDCSKIMELSEIKNPELLTRIKKQQSNWFNSEVENRNYEYKNKPEWML